MDHYPLPAGPPQTAHTRCRCGRAWPCAHARSAPAATIDTRHGRERAWLAALLLLAVGGSVGILTLGAWGVLVGSAVFVGLIVLAVTLRWTT